MFGDGYKRANINKQKLQILTICISNVLYY